MRIILFSDDTQIRTSEGQDYKRTVYLLDHNVTAAVVSTSTIFVMCNYYCILAKHTRVGSVGYSQTYTGGNYPL